MLSAWRHLPLFAAATCLLLLVARGDTSGTDGETSGNSALWLEPPPAPPVPEIVAEQRQRAADPPPDDHSEEEEEDLEKPSENPDLFEGDISNIHMGDPSRNAIRNENKLWTNGNVPYYIARNFNSAERAVITSAVNEYRRKTCIRFVPRSNERDYVYFQKRRGCSSDVGRTGNGAQIISLGSGCVHHGVVVHEMMHALGFWHEQSRADRDQYVTIYWGNILPGLSYNFGKYTLRDIQHLGEAYDYGSIMHYERTAFSRDNRSPTIVPKRAGVFIGQRTGLSTVDVRKIQKLYKCDGGGGGGGVTTTAAPQTCRDRAEFCQYWSQQGYCTAGTYRSYMSANCRQSCNLCDGGGVTVACTDNHRYCGSWASIGECTANPGYMMVNCKLSCNNCDGECNNRASERSCVYWAGIGECNANPAYMLVNCKKSCNRC